MFVVRAQFDLPPHSGQSAGPTSVACVACPGIYSEARIDMQRPSPFADLLDGRLDVLSPRGGGTRVRATFPAR